MIPRGPGPNMIVAPTVVMNDTITGGLSVTIAGEDDRSVKLVFRSFEEVVDSGILEGLQSGVGMMVGLGIWKTPEIREPKIEKNEKGLRACPFCGKTTVKSGIRDDVGYVDCKECRITIDFWNKDEPTSEQWNRRSP